MSILTIEQKEEFNNFIANNNPSKLPLVDIKAKKTIKRSTRRISYKVSILL